MNYFKKLSKGLKGKDRVKNLVISIVILVEIISILTVATFAWVETVSSLKITNNDDETIVDTYVFTSAMIGNKQGTIDLGKYFRQGGDMHLSPASSADGRTMFFPQMASATSYGSTYRKGNVNDKNTLYLSVSFKLKTDANADFYFTDVPTFSNFGSDIRVSVTAYSEGADPNTYLDERLNPPQYVSTTKIYALTASNAAVVNSTSGGTIATNVESFDAHRKKTGQTSANRLFAVGANETKIVTINLWLQKSSTDMDTAYSTLMSVSNFGIVSDLTPRHVTLIPTPEWDLSNTTEYFYAWCWDSSKGEPDKLYGPLTLDANEHYSFDYNGTYQSTLFFRCGNPNLTTASMSTNWSNLGLWNKTADTAIPSSPVDPTYVIKTISGGAYDGDISGNKSTGEWIDPVKINIAYTTDPANQSSTWGKLSATTYIGTSTSTNVMEQTNTSSQKHKTTVHGWSGKRLKLSVSDIGEGYAFVGWYSTADGSGSALSTNANYDFNISTAAGLEVTYYAKFKETRKITLNKYLDGYSSTANVGTFKIDSDVSGSGSTTSINKVVDKGATVTLSATPASGYSVAGFYNVSSNGTALSPMTTSGTTKSVQITASSANYNTDYYVRFTSNEYKVKAHAYYSTNNGSNYNADNATGGTVKVGDAAAGATSEANVKYKKTVELVADPDPDYEFVGWFETTSATNALSTNTSYTYTLNTAGAVNVYARFKLNRFSVTAKAYYNASAGASSYSAGSTGGTVSANSATPAAQSEVTGVEVNSSVTLLATPASGYVFGGWYNGTGSNATCLETSESYTYTLTSYNDVTVYARFRKGDIYLSGWINGVAVTSYQNAMKFTHGSNPDEYVLTYTFTGSQDGYQYATFSDQSLTGSNYVYHPTNHESGSGVAANSSGTNTSMNGDPKWRLNATAHDVAVITWNNNTKTPTWNITKYYYFDCSACSWYTNDSCVPGVSYNYGAYQKAEFVSSNFYRIAIPEDVSTFSLGRTNNNGTWNAFDVTKDGTKNRYNINSSSNGGSWTTY